MILLCVSFSRQGCVFVVFADAGLSVIGAVVCTSPHPAPTMAVVNSPKQRKRKAQADWSGGNHTVKSALLGWMANVFWIQGPRTRNFPETPALGRLIASAQKDLWSDDCYCEMTLLGEVAGLPFSEYARKLPRHTPVEGCCLALPIILEQEEDAEAKFPVVAHNAGPSRAAKPLTGHEEASPKVVVSSAVGETPSASESSVNLGFKGEDDNGNHPLSSPTNTNLGEAPDRDDTPSVEITDSEFQRYVWRNMPYLGETIAGIPVPTRQELGYSD